MSKKEKPRSTSIARRINSHLRWQQLGNMIGGDFVILLLGTMFWCYLAETERVVDWRPWMQRSLTLGEGGSFYQMLRAATYTFTAPGLDGQTFTVDAGVFFSTFFVLLIVLFSIQFFGWIVKCVSGTAEIRRFLKPIDDIALAAERVSAQQLDASKFRSLEEAIGHINAAMPDAKLSVGDAELAGLETAVNNLIARMHETYRQQVRFVDDASHELRTPIAVIQGYANMLDRWGKEDETVLNESIAAIKTESDHMKTLVEQLLFLARGDMGRQQFQPEHISLRDMLREIHEESELIDSAHLYALQLQNTASVYADPVMLKQAVRILVDNAAKYTPAGNKILLRLRENEKGMPCIDVQDTGIGIAEKDVVHMFERFYRSDAARSSKEGGSGLGLSIAKWIVEQHGGYLKVISSEGIGTRVSICLPAPTQNS
ncbi:MAG: sensor histidine kinase [Clostridiales bacterium]|nr:sensor histidine kinase [Clostridiales bacterium]